MLWSYISLVNHDDCRDNLHLWKENFNIFKGGSVSYADMEDGMSQDRMRRGHMVLSVLV